MTLPRAIRAATNMKGMVRRQVRRSPYQSNIHSGRLDLAHQRHTYYSSRVLLEISACISQPSSRMGGEEAWHGIVKPPNQWAANDGHLQRRLCKAMYSASRRWVGALDGSIRHARQALMHAPVPAPGPLPRLSKQCHNNRHAADSACRFIPARRPSAAAVGDLFL